MHKKIGFGLLVLIALAAMPMAQADDVIGSSGSYGWRSWTAGNVNSNGTPYWDGASWDGANKNIGNCLLGNGGCMTQVSPAPGAIPYWGSSTGAADPNFYFNHLNGGSNSLVLQVEIAGNANINQFGWFGYNNTSGLILSETILFNGPAGGGATATFTPTLNYGFYFIGANGQKYYTLSSKNTQDTGNQHFALFNASGGVYYLGIEDLNFNNSDKDYNDMIIKVTTTTATPEPATLILLGTGLLGAGGLKRRKKKA